MLEESSWRLGGTQHICCVGNVGNWKLLNRSTKWQATNKSAQNYFSSFRLQKPSDKWQEIPLMNFGCSSNLPPNSAVTVSLPCLARRTCDKVGKKPKTHGSKREMFRTVRKIPNKIRMRTLFQQGCLQRTSASSGETTGKSYVWEKLIRRWAADLPNLYKSPRWAVLP